MTLAELTQRLRQAQQLHAAGVLAAEAARELGISRATYYRLVAQSQVGGVLPAKPQPKLGRPRAYELDAEETAFLRYQQGTNPSLPEAVDRLLGSDVCRPETAAYFRGLREREAAKRVPLGSLVPPSIRQAAFVDAAQRAGLRGRKQSQNFSPVIRRSLAWTDEEGQTHGLLYNDLWESDDMSINKPFRFADEHNVLTAGRQGLYTADLATGRYLLTSLIGRPKDAYRVEDIAMHLRTLVEAYGLPLFWRVERGVWENGFIDGISLDKLASTHAWAAHLKGKKWGGLSHLFKVLHTWSSRGKGYIEQSFDLLQTLLDHNGPGLTIGRHRGEFEEAAKQLRRAQEGQLDALQKFWSIEQACDAVAEAAERFNLRPKLRRACGAETVVPEELARELAQPKRECPASEQWRLLPVKKVGTIMGGMVTVTAPHYPLPFTFAINTPEFGYLRHGHTVLVAFDPMNPTEGCHIFNGDLGKNNAEGMNFGQFLKVATYVTQDVPQIDLRVREDGRPENSKRGSHAALAAEMSVIKQAGKQEATTRQSIRQDAAGQVFTQGPTALPALPQPSQKPQTLPFVPVPAADETAEADLAAAFGDL